jgi:hypothetical protein
MIRIESGIWKLAQFTGGNTVLSIDSAELKKAYLTPKGIADCIEY